MSRADGGDVGYLRRRNAVFRERSRFSMAKGTPPSAEPSHLEAEDFVRALPPSCDRMIGGWVYRQLDFHLPEYLKPHPSDHILSDLSIDPDDYSDMGRDHFERWSLPTPSPLDPEVLPEDPTVEAFVRYLTQRTKRS